MTLNILMVAGTRSERFGCLAFALFPPSYLPFPFTFPSFALPSLLGGEGKGKEKYYLNAASLCYNSSASGWRNIIRNLRRFFQSSLMAREKDSKKEKEKKRVHLNIRPIIYKLAPGCPSKEGEWTLGCHTVDFPRDPSLLFLSPKGKGEKRRKKRTYE